MVSVRSAKLLWQCACVCCDNTVHAVIATDIVMALCDIMLNVWLMRGGSVQKLVRMR